MFFTFLLAKKHRHGYLMLLRRNSMKFRDLIDHNTSKMGKAMFGISNADSAISYNKIIGNKTGTRSAIGRKGGYTASLNAALRKSRNH